MGKIPSLRLPLIAKNPILTSIEMITLINMTGMPWDMVMLTTCKTLLVLQNRPKQRVRAEAGSSIILVEYATQLVAI